ATSISFGLAQSCRERPIAASGVLRVVLAVVITHSIARSMSQVSFTMFLSKSHSSLSLHYLSEKRSIPYGIKDSSRWGPRGRETSGEGRSHQEWHRYP